MKCILTEQKKKEEEKVTSLPVVNITSTDGIAYTGELPIEPYVGLTIIVVPNKTMVVSEDDSLDYPTLNGVEVIPSNLRQGIGTVYLDKAYISINTPLVITYFSMGNTNYWKTNGVGAYSAKDLIGAVPISKGGTGATTKEEALVNLGAASNEELTEVKKSVSDGKILVANAITGKGITTATTATFNTMATNITSISTLATETADATATASEILSGKTAYIKGSKITGNIASKIAQTYTPTTSNITIAAKQYLSGAQTIKGDSNLKAENIKSGISIFGVKGSLAALGNLTWDSCRFNTYSGFDNSGSLSVALGTNGSTIGETYKNYRSVTGFPSNLKIFIYNNFVWLRYLGVTLYIEPSYYENKNIQATTNDALYWYGNRNGSYYYELSFDSSTGTLTDNSYSASFGKSYGIIWAY